MTMAIEITSEQLEQLGLKQHEWDRLNEEEQDAVFMQIELPGQGDGDDDEPADGKEKPAKEPKAKTGDLGAEDDLPDLTKKAKEPAEKPAAEAKTPAEPTEPSKEPAATTLTPEEQLAQDQRLLAFDYAFVFKPADGADTTKLQAEIDTIVAKKAELTKAVNDGDKTLADVMGELGELNTKQARLEVKIETATEAKGDAAKAQGQRWNQAQELFMTREKSKVYTDDVAAFAVLSSFVQQLSQKPDVMGKGMMYLLFEADRLTRQRLKLDEKVAATPAAPPPKKDDKTKKPAPRTPDLTGVPNTLGAVPAADIHSEDDGPFAHLDKLDGPEFTAALAKLPAAQREAYKASLDR